MLVKEIMTEDVKTVSPRSTIQEAAKAMAELGIGCLIVVEKSHLAGIITERDLLRKVVSKNRKPSEVKVSSVMTKEVVVIGPDAEIEDAANAMTERKIKRLPVISGSRLIGIVTAVDIVAAEPRMMEQIAKLVLFHSKKKIAAG